MTEEIQRGTKRRKASNERRNFKNAKKSKKFRISGSNDNAEGKNMVRKMDRKMKKMFQKRARDYNSDDDAEDKGEEELELLNNNKRDGVVVESSDNEEGDESMDERNENSEDEDGEIQPGIMRFMEGCKAFRLAFKKITKRSAYTDDDILGPVLSAHKKLVASKLAEEEAERKVKGEAKKEKHLAGEKGHVKPANYLDSHEKFLIGVATRGVVKLFNAVNKAQHAQKGLNPSRAKDEKAIRRRRKEAFFSELGKKSSQPSGSTAKVGRSTSTGEENGPAWAPLRDNYMLTNSKLKDWDKMPDTTVADDFGKPPDTETSSDDD